MDRRNEVISRRSVLLAAGASVAQTAMARPAQAVTVTRDVRGGPEQPVQRAALAEEAVVRRHLRAPLGEPGARLGLLAWPATLVDHLFLRWCYWWQAHLLDCAVDAASRARTPDRIAQVRGVAQGIRLRNITGWTNRYFDDMGWLALALERSDRQLDVQFGAALDDLRSALVDGWNPMVGAVPWRAGDDYYNTPAIGPTALAMARLGELSRARQLSDFLHTRLRDPQSGLILDGVHEPGGHLDRTVHTYSQGVTIGLETELATRTGESKHRDRAAALIAATGERLTNAGVIAAAGADDSGLFMGILARYLAEAALSLGDTTAAAIVHASARAAWNNRAEVAGLPLFGVDWARPITTAAHTADFHRPPRTSVAAPANLSRDLSVQLSGWMLLEADYRLAAAGL
ncbi:glycoside hydrolase family 76 protein [Nocardia sp. XZ_19_385]|uniref:glycoside hydrolase family 76 protein n=1 Tax=Nocardia sp. XZ_19_385 TaxID=2769488 RepID=UPI00188E8FE2|nr:glycoside hydrolase family 76 protein [Nocardia sp. XZ_19_385]